MESVEVEDKMPCVSKLPEDCISSFISLTSPRDACSASTISRGFQSAADSDTVWEQFLPSDYRDIISRSASPVVYPTKKQLYFGLCNSYVLLDEGRMSFSLSKWGGKKCFMLSARGLSIAWKDNPAYWRWISIPTSRFSEVAMLEAVCWLDVQGKMPTRMLSPNTTYAAYLVFGLTDNSRGLEFQLKASVRIASASEKKAEEGSEDGTNSICLRSLRHKRRPRGLFRWMNTGYHCRFPQNRTDGWMEVELGEFFNDKGGDWEVEMGFMETKLLNWKSGLIVEGIELRPKEG